MLFRRHSTFLRDKTNGNSHHYSTGREDNRMDPLLDRLQKPTPNTQTHRWNTRHNHHKHTPRKLRRIQHLTHAPHQDTPARHINNFQPLSQLFHLLLSPVFLRDWATPLVASSTFSPARLLTCPLGQGTSREHAPLTRRADPTRLNFSIHCITLKVYGKLFYMILTALLSVRKKLSVAQKYFKCNTTARLSFNVHVCLWVSFMEKPSIALSSKSISTVEQEPFMESCYRSFFYTKIKASSHKNAW